MDQIDAIGTMAGRAVPLGLRRDLAALVDAVPLDFGGGSSLCKALVLADLIIANDLERVLEIGVYHGRLLLPLGFLMTALERGEAVGIDPYTAAAAVQSDTHDRGVDLTAWPAQVDWEGLHSDVLAAIETHAIGERCRVVRARSDEAAADFASGSIDLLHVDGNHDAASVARDVELYLSKVSPGGFIVMDDASWSSVRPTCERLATEHELVFQLFDGGVTVDGVGGNDFAVFRISEPASRGVRR